MKRSRTQVRPFPTSREANEAHSKERNKEGRVPEGLWLRSCDRRPLRAAPRPGLPLSLVAVNQSLSSRSVGAGQRPRSFSEFAVSKMETEKSARIVICPPAKERGVLLSPTPYTHRFKKKATQLPRMVILLRFLLRPQSKTFSRKGGVA